MHEDAFLSEIRIISAAIYVILENVENVNYRLGRSNLAPVVKPSCKIRENFLWMWLLLVLEKLLLTYQWMDQM